MQGSIKKILVSLVALTSLLFSGLNASGAASKQAQLQVQTPKVDNQQIAARTAPPPKSFKLNAGITQEYVLGPGDVMSITDLSSDEEKGQTTMAPVLPDGTAVVNYAGVIEAAGLSLREINALVNEKAKKWFVNPEIIVNLARQRATQVYLLGEVTHPGLYSPSTSGAKESGGSESGGSGGSSEGSSQGPPTNAASSIFTVSSALELAGGLKETADIRHIHVTRLHPKQVIDVDLWKLMLDGDVGEDLVLQPGDVIYIPKGGADFNSNDFGKVVANSHKVRVLGAVKSPGLMMMSGDDDVLSVIAKAGGFTDTAKDKFVTLSRTNRDGSIKTEKVSMKGALKNPEAQARVKVRAGDVIIVHDSNTKKALKYTGRVVPQMLMNAAMQTMMFRLNTTTTTK